MDPGQFNTSVYHARKRLFRDILQLDNQDSGISPDIGPYMPSDLIHEVLELNELRKSVIRFN